VTAPPKVVPAGDSNEVFQKKKFKGWKASVGGGFEH